MFLLALVAIIIVVGLLFPGLRKICAILLLVLAVCFSMGLLTFAIPAWSALGIEMAAVTLTAGEAAMLVGGAAVFLFPDETAEVVQSMGEHAGQVAAAAGAAAGAILGGALSGISSSPVFLIGAGLLLFWFLSKKKHDKDDDGNESQLTSQRTAQPRLEAA